MLAHFVFGPQDGDVEFEPESDVEEEEESEEGGLFWKI